MSHHPKESPAEVNFDQRGDPGGADGLFYRRWSPRSFTGEKISSKTLAVIFNAARFAPSCNNEQPWIFITSSGPADFDLFLRLLDNRNQRWARTASLLGFVVARRHFSGSSRRNSWAAFDCGAAWMSLTLQARRLGWYTHGMAGIDKEQVYQTFQIPRSQFRVICGFALGRRDHPERLPADLLEREHPSSRVSLGEIWVKGDSFAREWFAGRGSKARDRRSDGRQD